VLIDTHGIGGDPAKGEVYGYASRSPRKGIITLRNPADQPGRISLDVRSAFELPAGSSARYAVESRWHGPNSETPHTLQAGHSINLRLAPFEVLVLEATPAE